MILKFFLYLGMPENKNNIVILQSKMFALPKMEK